MICTRRLWGRSERHGAEVKEGSREGMESRLLMRQGGLSDDVMAVDDGSSQGTPFYENGVDLHISPLPRISSAGSLAIDSTYAVITPEV